MPPSEKSLPPDLQPDLQREIQSGRKFSLSEAIGREGGSFLKGSQEMVPRPLRALAAINQLIEQHLNDPSGVLQSCLQRWVKADMRVGKYLDEPEKALQLIATDIAQTPQVLYEFARQVAVEWGQVNGERPYFQKPGAPPSSDVAYTHATIQKILAELVNKLQADG